MLVFVTVVSGVTAQLTTTCYGMECEMMAMKEMILQLQRVGTLGTIFALHL